MSKLTKEALKRRQNNLRQKEKAAQRQAARLSKIGDQIYSDKSTHEAALRASWQEGFRQGLKHAATLPSIAVVRREAADHEAEAAE